MRKNRKYTAEEKLKYVKMYLEEGVSKKQIARELNMSTSNIRRWISNYEEHGAEYFNTEHRGQGTKGKGKGNIFSALHTSKKLSKEERLELENLKLRIENERLKKGYMVKGVGANKEFVTISDANMK